MLSEQLAATNDQQVNLNTRCNLFSNTTVAIMINHNYFLQLECIRLVASYHLLYIFIVGKR